MKPLDIFRVTDIDIKFMGKYYYCKTAQIITYKITRKRFYSLGFMCRNKNKIVRFYPNKKNNTNMKIYCKIKRIPILYSNNKKYVDIPCMNNISKSNSNTLRKLSKKYKPYQLKDYNGGRKVKLRTYSFLFGISVPRNCLPKFSRYVRSTKHIN